jgi:hypothetical protein
MPRFVFGSFFGGHLFSIKSVALFLALFFQPSSIFNNFSALFFGLFRFVFGARSCVINNFSALLFKKGILFYLISLICPRKVSARRHWIETTMLAHKSQAKSPLCGCQKASVKASPVLRGHSDPAKREENLLLNCENVLRNGQKQIPRLPLAGEAPRNDGRGGAESDS